MISCGMKELVITPPLGLPIPGYFQTRPANGIRDELYAKALVLDDGSRKAAIVVLDAIGIEKEEVARIRERVFEMTGIPGDHVLVSATHTHTGGPVYRQKEFRDEAYLSFLVKRAADAVYLAAQACRPARIGLGRGAESDVPHNRRYVMEDGTVQTNPVGSPHVQRPAGPIDPDVMVVRIDDLDGQPIGVLTNFACHADTTGGRAYSGDYPGALSRALKKSLGEHVVSLFVTGACGDINHLDVTKKEQRTAEEIGLILAGEVLKTRAKIATTDHFPIAAASRLIRAEARLPSSEDVEKARQLLARAEREPDSGIKPADLFFALQCVTLHEYNETSVDIEVQVLRFGDWAVVGVPCELFVEFGLTIKSDSLVPFTMMATFAGGVNGYVQTREAFRQGGYEARLTSRSRLLPAAGYDMVSTALELLNESNR